MFFEKYNDSIGRDLGQSSTLPCDSNPGSYAYKSDDSVLPAVQNSDLRTNLLISSFVTFWMPRTDRQMVHRSIQGDQKCINIIEAEIGSLAFRQRSYQRWLDRRIYKTEKKFWAVLGSWGCKEKTPNCHYYFSGCFFSTFCGQNFLSFLRILQGPH